MPNVTASSESHWSADRLLKHMPRRTAKLYTLTTMGSGQTDYVRIFTIQRGELVELTYHLSQLTSYRMDSKGRGLKLGGGGYSKALDVAIATWRARFGETLPQSQWEQI